MRVASDILAGAHFDNNEQLLFSSIVVVTQHLSEWIGRSGIELKIEQKEGQLRPSSIQLRYEPPSGDETFLDDLKVELGFNYGISGDHIRESRISQGCYIRISPKEPQRLDDLLDHAGALQDLVTIATGRTAAFQAITLRHNDRVRKLPDGKEIPESIELLMQWQPSVSDDTRRLLPHEMFFTFEQVEGTAGIAKWLSTVRTYRPCLGLLLSPRYMKRMYMQHRYQSAAIAAEAFHRIRFSNDVMPKKDFRELRKTLVGLAPEEWHRWLEEQLAHSNEPRFKQRLEQMASHAGPAFSTLVVDVTKWSKLAKDMRNRIVHPQTGQLRKYDPSAMYFVSESLYYLVTLCLLREAGVSDGVIASIETNQSFKWLRTRLEEVSRNPFTGNPDSE